MKEKRGAQTKVVLLDVELIDSSLFQARKVLNSQEIKRLAASIVQNGLLQPISVRPRKNGRFELIAGERRLRACKMAQWRKIPALICYFEDEKAAALSLLENLQREQLNAFEQAMAFRELLDLWGCSQQSAARRLGISPSTMANKLRLLAFTPVQQMLCVNAGLTERHARAVLRLANEEIRTKALKFVIENDYTVYQTEQLIEKILQEEIPKKKKNIMVQDVRIFMNTIDQAIRLMTGSGIPATTQKNLQQEYIEYVVRIPTSYAIAKGS